jgi:hypothetical protein
VHLARVDTALADSVSLEMLAVLAELSARALRVVDVGMERLHKLSDF